MNDTYISKNGEITSKATLISEIESLLNVYNVNDSNIATNDMDNSQRTILSPIVMDSLSCADLEHIRDSLLAKNADVIARNHSWLLGLVDD